jgi:hypothetical protein
MYEVSCPVGKAVDVNPERFKPNIQCVRKVAVHLQKVLEVMSTSVYTGLNWITKLNTLPVLNFNRCLTTEYRETTAHFNGNFDTDNQIYVP